LKLNSPTIYVLHKVKGQWAQSAFNFDGLVDRRRVKREIIKSYRRAGEVVAPAYIEASIEASLRRHNAHSKNVLLGTKVLACINDAVEAHEQDANAYKTTT
jgi:hypothetical protein